MQAERNRSSATFTDIARTAGLTVPSIYGGLERKRFIIETNGAGVAWVDVDQDGWLDALVLGGTRLAEGARIEDARIAAAGPTTRLYRNTGHGTFADVTAQSGLGLTVFASSVCAGDYDNDGAVDLFITSFGRNYLFHNRGDGRFDDVTAQAGLPTAGPARWGSGCSFVDYDRDGRLDLFVSNYLKFDGHVDTNLPNDALTGLEGGQTPHVIVEMLANVNLDRDLDVISPRGRIVIIGNRGRGEIDARKAMGKDATIRGLMVFNASREELHEAFAGINAGLETGALRPRIGRRIPLADAAQAHEAVMSPGALGKIVLIP